MNKIRTYFGAVSEKTGMFGAKFCAFVAAWPKSVLALVIPAAGIMGGLAFMPVWWSLFPLVAYLWAMFYVLQNARARLKAMLQVWSMTAIAYMIAFAWMMNPFEFTNFSWLAPYAVALFVVLFSLGTIVFATAFSYKRGIFAFAASFALGEWIKSLWLGGFPWNTVAHVWQSSIVMQVLSLVGTYGLAFLTVFILTPSRDHIRLRIGLAVFVLLFGLGRIMIYRNTPPTMYRVRVVSQDSAWNPDDMSQLVSYINFSRAPLFSRINLVIWPESGLRYNLTVSPDIVEQIHAGVGTNILATFDRRVHGLDGSVQVYNSSGLITRWGMDVYDKVRLVPFGEYVPDFFKGLTKFTEGGIDFSAGGNRMIMQNADMRFIPLICFEIIFPGLRLPGDTAFIANPSNDMWMSHQGRIQIWQQARFRAVEEGVPVIRASNTGYSGFISPLGISVISMYGDGFRDAFVPARLPRPIFSWTGNAPVIAFLFAVMLLPHMGRLMLLPYIKRRPVKAKPGAKAKGRGK